MMITKKYSVYNENLPYLKIEECRGGYLYLISSRNLVLGVYNEQTKGFSGIRTKFGNRYVFEEYHWDFDDTFGTVKPIKELEMCDYFTLCDENLLFEWLDTKLVQYKQLIEEITED